MSGISWGCLLCLHEQLNTTGAWRPAFKFNNEQKLRTKKKRESPIFNNLYLILPQNAPTSTQTTKQNLYPPRTAYIFSKRSHLNDNILSIQSLGFWQCARHAVRPENPLSMLCQRMPEWSPLRSVIACLFCHAFTLFLILSFLLPED